MPQPTQFTIKNLSQEIIDLTRKAAKEKGVKLGTWIEAALRAALIPEEQKLDDLLRQTAKIQKKAFDALVSEGFNERQALTLVIGKSMGEASKQLL